MPEHFIAFWNVENLFGPEDHPHREERIASRIRSDLVGWDRAMYDRKCAQLSDIIAGMDTGSGPDILGVCEVEDAHVLGDLVAALEARLPDRSYGIVHAQNDADWRGIDTAFIYDRDRYSVDPDLVFNHFVVRRTGTRDILQATFRTMAGNDLVLLCNHWPARKGNPEGSAGFRATAGETLAYWHDRIREETGTRTPILAMGDFNDDPWDASVMVNANAKRERGDVERSNSAMFYNFAWEYMQVTAISASGRTRRLAGTLYYDNDGCLYDQMLANRALLDSKAASFKVVDGSARMETPQAMVDNSVSRGPRRFGLPKGKASKVDLDGYSDHFPVSIRLIETE
ncbi:MAG: endonuclease/exonuclease/phosphatase family protein [Pseudomonadota bacterium]